MTAKIKHVLCIILVLILVVASIIRVSDLLQQKESDLRYLSFLTEDNAIDVLILGSSHTRHGIFATELWNDYGISSYNMSANGSTIPVCYWTLVNALDYQTPQMVVLDVFNMWPERVCSTSFGQVHNQFDFFPLSMNKYHMVKDLFSDTELTDDNGNNLYQKRWELLFDLGEYHTRWTDLVEYDFMSKTELEKQSAVWKGSSPLMNVVDRNEKIYPDSWDDVKYDNLSKEYLIKIINLCNEKRIKLLLINTSYDCDNESKLFADSVYDIAMQYDKTYLDFTQMDIINFQTDLYSTDHNTHVNFSGAEKITKYIGDYLSNNFDLEDHRNDDNYSQWWEDYQEYVSSKLDYLKEQTDIAYYLMFLSDDDYKTVIEIKDNTILFEGRNQAMLENLGIDFNETDDCNFFAIDNGTGLVSYMENGYNNTDFDTCIGEFNIYYADDFTSYGVYLDKKELYTKHIAEDDEERMRITVISKATGEVVDIRTF